MLTCDGRRVPVEDLVFVTKAGTPFDAPTVTHRFQALLKRAGIGLRIPMMSISHSDLIGITSE